MLHPRPVRPSPARPQSEPNITPLIDVLLVLLIIFLAAIPLTQQGLDLSLPPEERQPEAPPAPAPHVVLEYSGDRRLTINHQPVTLADLETRLREIFRDRRDRTLFVSGDPSLRYGEVIEVIDSAKGAGVERVGVITPEMRREAGK